MYGDFTFSIIKPNAVRTGKTGPILAMINEGGFEIAAMRMVKMTTHRLKHFILSIRENHFLKVLLSL
jgi:nucleoside-diphosphate kinase